MPEFLFSLAFDATRPNWGTELLMQPIKALIGIPPIRVIISSATLIRTHMLQQTLISNSCNMNLPFRLEFSYVSSLEQLQGQAQQKSADLRTIDCLRLNASDEAVNFNSDLKFMSYRVYPLFCSLSSPLCSHIFSRTLIFVNCHPVR